MQVRGKANGLATAVSPDCTPRSPVCPDCSQSARKRQRGKSENYKSAAVVVVAPDHIPTFFALSI